MHEAESARIIKEVVFMKSFFSLFRDSAAELKNVRTLTVTGMLTAIAIVLRAHLALNITQDLRVDFAFLFIMTAAMLYGPVLSVLCAIGTDVIGYILDGYKARDYNFALLTVKILVALIYGIMLYRSTFKNSSARSDGSGFFAMIKKDLPLILRASAARIIVVFLGNIVLNSAVLYYSYTNPNFPFMSQSEWDAFFLWLSPRFIKNIICLPIEIILIAIVLPAIYSSYRMVFGTRRTA